MRPLDLALIDKLADQHMVAGEPARHAYYNAFEVYETRAHKIVEFYSALLPPELRESFVTAAELVKKVLSTGPSPLADVLTMDSSIKEPDIIASHLMKLGVFYKRDAETWIFPY